MSWRETLNLGKLFLGNLSVELEGFSVVMTVNAEATNQIIVDVQVNNAEGVALEKVAVLDWYLSDDALGAVPTAGVPDGGVLAGTAGGMLLNVADAAGKLITDVTGLVNVEIDDVTGTPTWYLVVIPPTGGLIISDAITFA